MLMPFFLLTPIQAANLNQATADRDERIEPIQVAAGPHAGKWAIPTRVAADPAFADLAPMFAVLTPTALKAEEAWPPEPEE